MNETPPCNIHLMKRLIESWCWFYFWMRCSGSRKASCSIPIAIPLMLLGVCIVSLAVKLVFERLWGYVIDLNSRTFQAVLFVTLGIPLLVLSVWLDRQYDQPVRQALAWSLSRDGKVTVEGCVGHVHHCFNDWLCTVRRGNLALTGHIGSWVL